MSRGTVCGVHVHDSMIPEEDHHIWPRCFHGPDIASNKIRLCCNAHSDAHYYMNALLKSGGVTPSDWRTYGPAVRALAKSGYDQVMAYGESLAATYELKT